MEVYNVRAEVYKILSSVDELKKVSVDYPSDWTEFPTAIYRTGQTPHFLDSSKNELQTHWTITIELYANQAYGNISPIADKVSDLLKEIGFTGTIKDANTGGLYRKIIDYQGIVDNQMNYVFQK